MHYLGHVVSGRGIFTNPNKVPAVRAHARPTNLAKVKAFLYVVGYYRRFFENFATLAKLLYKRTSKEEKSVFGEEHGNAFSPLKLLVSEVLALACPDTQKNCIHTLMSFLEELVHYRHIVWRHSGE